MKKEIWRDVEGFEELYEVSNLGRVRSLDRIVERSNGTTQTWKGRELRQVLNKCGYRYVNLHKDGKLKFCRVHRLVANAFIPNPNRLPEVNHRDEDKTNNAVENLEWCTSKYNTNYGTRNERVAEKQTNDPKRSKPVEALDNHGNVVYRFPSVKEANRNGFDRSNVVACCRGERHYHHGLKWRYVTEATAKHPIQLEICFS